MGIVKVRKVSLFAPMEEKDQLLSFLHEEGKIHVDHVSETLKQTKTLDVPDTTEYDRFLSDVKTSCDFLKRYTDVKVDFIQSFFEFKYAVDKDFVDNLDRNLDEIREQILPKVKSLNSTMDEKKKTVAKYKMELQKLELYKDADINFSHLRDTEFTKAMIGIIPKKKYHSFKHNVDDVLSNEVVGLKGPFMEKVSERKKDYIIVIRYLPRCEGHIITMLQEHNFKKLDHPVSYRGHVKEVMDDLARKITDLELEIEGLEEKAKALSKEHLTNLWAVLDEMSERVRRMQLENRIGATEKVALVVGWVRVADAPELRKRIKARFPGVSVFITDAEEGDEPPVALTNNKILRPVEIVTEMYSLPMYGEFDPTPMFAPFFLLFFPLCLGDAGYGFMLIIISYLMLKKVKMGNDGRRLFNLLIICGFITIFVGMFMGSWFGLPKEYLPSILLKAVILDPLDPTGSMYFLLFCFVLGIVQSVYTAYSISFYKKVRESMYIEGFLDDILAMVFLTGLILFALAYFGLDPFESLYDPIMYFFMGGTIVFFISQLHHGEGAVGRLGSAVWSIYNVGVGAIGDVLSYSRLLALGLATTAIGMVFNTMAFMLADSVPVIGVIAMLVVMLIGAVFNLIISSLGAFVHTMRLQYVEFFAKFYEGGGRDFQPLKKEYKHVQPVDGSKLPRGGN